MPLGASDNLDKDIRIGPDDVPEVAGQAAERAGYSLKSWGSNPFAGEVDTVADMVYFLTHQPRRA